MQILRYYINHKGGTNNLFVCRIINSRLQTIKTFTGEKAQERAFKYAKKHKKALYDAYNTRSININPYAADAKKMKVRKLTSVQINLANFGFGSFSASGNADGMRTKYYGKGALLVRDGDIIYNVTEAPDIYYNHSI